MFFIGNYSKPVWGVEITSNAIAVLNVLCAVVALFLNTVTQIISYRTILRSSLLKSILLGFLVGSGSIFLFYLFIFSRNKSGYVETFALLVANEIIFFALWYCFFNFINMGETARRIRIMRELQAFPEGLTYPEFLQRYNAREMVQRRLDRLLGTGQIFEREERLFLNKPIVLIIAEVVKWMKIIVMGKKSEFD